MLPLLIWTKFFLCCMTKTVGWKVLQFGRMSWFRWEIKEILYDKENIVRYNSKATWVPILRNSGHQVFSRHAGFAKIYRTFKIKKIQILALWPLFLENQFFLPEIRLCHILFTIDLHVSERSPDWFSRKFPNRHACTHARRWVSILGPTSLKSVGPEKHSLSKP